MDESIVSWEGPVSNSTPESGSATAADSGSEPSGGSEEVAPLRVLLIDDGAVDSVAYSRLVGDHSQDRLTVSRVSSQADAFESLGAGQHDVYVISHYVGKRTGFDILSWMATQGLRVPVVFLVGANDHATGISAVNAGASCYVTSNTIDSSLLEHSIYSAAEQVEVMSKLRGAGITVDSDASSRARTLYRIAEAVREPANVVLDQARRSLETTMPATAHHAFGLIDDRATMLLTLANDLNDLAMIEAGHLRLSAEAFSLRGFIFNLNQAYESRQGSQHPPVSVEISQDVPDAVIGDPGRLRLMVVTFIESLVGRTGASRIVVRLGVEDRGEGTVTLSSEIVAFGGGTAEGTTRRILDSRPVGPPSVLPDADALAMPAALELLSRMGGTVEVDTAKDAASSIRLTLRLQTSEETEQPRPDLNSEPIAEDDILIIAEDEEARRLLVNMFHAAGIVCSSAATVGAWRTVRASNGAADTMPSLVVIESQTDSFAVSDEFITTVGLEIPIMVIVADGMRGDASRCRERGIRGYLSRPVNSTDLVDVARSVAALEVDNGSTPLVTRHWLREGRPSLHVLVVDDSTTNLFLLTRMLEQRGHSIIAACDGEEASIAAEKGVFDVVLMDIVMPGMNGFDATRKIREFEAQGGNRSLIIGVSAFTDQSNLDQAGRSGMDGFLAKPVRPEVLFAAIEQLDAEALIAVK